MLTLHFLRVSKLLLLLSSVFSTVVITEVVSVQFVAVMVTAFLDLPNHSVIQYSSRYSAHWRLAVALRRYKTRHMFDFIFSSHVLKLFNLSTTRLKMCQCSQVWCGIYRQPPLSFASKCVVNMVATYVATVLRIVICCGGRREKTPSGVDEHEGPQKTSVYLPVFHPLVNKSSTMANVMIPCALKIRHRVPPDDQLQSFLSNGQPFS